MPFTDASVDSVHDETSEIQVLRSFIRQGQLRIGDQVSAELTDDERDAIRTRMNQRIQVLRATIKARVDTW